MENNEPTLPGLSSYGTDLMQRRSFARVRARARARQAPHSSSRSTTRELERCHTRVRVVSLSSPRIATRSAIALAQTPDLLFPLFSANNVLN